MEKNQSNNVLSISLAKKLNPVSTRGKIINTYIELITKQGFAATTNKLLAEKAKVSESTIYYHFAKKTVLYEAVFQHAHNKFLELIEDDDMFFGKLEDRVTLLTSLSWHYLQSPLYSATMEIRLVTRNDKMMKSISHLTEYFKKRNQRLRQILVESKVSDRQFREALTHFYISLIGLSYETIRKPKLANIGGYLRRISRNTVKMLKPPD